MRPENLLTPYFFKTVWQDRWNSLASGLTVFMHEMWSAKNQYCCTMTLYCSVPTQSAFFRPDYFLNSTKFIQIGFFFGKIHDKRNLYEKCLGNKVAIQYRYVLYQKYLNICLCHSWTGWMQGYFAGLIKHIFGPITRMYCI